jgi:hypothetical protein
MQQDSAVERIRFFQCSGADPLLPNPDTELSPTVLDPDPIRTSFTKKNNFVLINSCGKNFIFTNLMHYVLIYSVAKPEPEPELGRPEPYRFAAIRTGTVTFL